RVWGGGRGAGGWGGAPGGGCRPGWRGPGPTRRTRPSHEPVAQPGPDASEADGLVAPADGSWNRVELSELLRCQNDVGGCGVFLEILAPLSAGDRQNVLALREHPGKRDLRGGRAASGRDFAHGLGDKLIFRDRLLVEAGQLRAKVVRAEACLRGDLSRQESSPERGKTDEGSSMRRAPGDDVRQVVARPQRKLRLHRSDG